MFGHNGGMTSPLTLEPADVDGGCCDPTANTTLGPEEAKQRALMFKALADPNRLRLLSIVKASASGETCVCDLPGPLELSQPTVSHHLKILVEAGLLHREKRGTWAYFSLVPGALDEAAGSLGSL